MAKSVEDLVADDDLDQEAVDAIREIAEDIGEAIWVAAHTKSRRQAKDAFVAAADKLIVFAMADN